MFFKAAKIPLMNSRWLETLSLSGRSINHVIKVVAVPYDIGVGD